MVQQRLRQDVWSGRVPNIISCAQEDGSTLEGQVTPFVVRGRNGQPPAKAAIVHVSNHKQIEDALHRRNAILEAVNTIAEQCLRMDDVHETLETLLETLGRAFDVNHVYLLNQQAATQQDPSELPLQHAQWLAAEMVGTNAGARLQHMPTHAALWSRWEQTLRQGSPIHGRVGKFPLSERRALAQQGIRSLIVVPIFIGQEWWGYLGLHDCMHERVWSAVERNALHTVAGIIGTALLRRQHASSAPSVHNNASNVQHLFESLPDMLLVLDSNGYIIEHNPAVTRQLGYPASALQGMHLLHLLPTDQRELGEAFLAAARQHRSDVHHLPLRTHDATQLDIEAMIVAGTWDDQPVFFCAARDITERERQQSHEREHEHSRVMLHERACLARELHDTLGQVLDYVAVQSQAIRKMLSLGRVNMANAALEHLITVAQDADADMRQFIVGVNTTEQQAGTPLLDEHGFFSSVERFILDSAHLSDLPIDLVVPPAVPTDLFAPNVAMQLLRVIQEGVANVRKHARARSARIAFTVYEQYARCVIEDDGIGFDPQQIATGQSDRYGVQSMRERVAEVHGTFQIDSQPGRGTRLIIHVPHNKSAALPPAYATLSPGERFQATPAAEFAAPIAAAAPEPQAVAQAVLPEPEPTAETDELTERQIEVLNLVAQGCTYKQVGVVLKLSERTVKYHMGQIMHRLRVNSRAEALAYVRRTEQALVRAEPLKARAVGESDT
jgi:PAS domain S-box-containing protein